MEFQARHVVDLAALVLNHIPEVVEDHKAVLAYDVDAAEHALTKDWCPFMHFTDSPVVASQSLRVLSGEHVRMLSPSAVQCSSSTEFL